jgi:hypothetical protein
MIWIALAILLGLLPAAIAQKKDRNFVAWWIYGACLFIVALPHALLLRADEGAIEQRQVQQGYRKCPFCAEMIKQDAVVCRYCRTSLGSPNCPFCGAAISAAARSCPHCHEEWG